MDLDATHQEDPDVNAEAQGLQDLFEDVVPLPECPQSEHSDNDDDDENEDLFEVFFEGSGTIYGKTDPPFATYLSEQRENGTNIYYPFSGAREWELVVWLHETRLPLAKIDDFLRLDYVRISSNSKVPFSSKF